MSNPKLSEIQSPLSTPEMVNAEWVATPTDYAITDSTVTSSDLLSLKDGQSLDYIPETLEATDAIAFNFFPASPSQSSSPPQTAKQNRKNNLEQLLTPWGLGGFCCLLLANSLLTLSALTPEKIASPAVSSLPAKTALVKTDSSILNLSQTVPQNLSLSKLSELPNPVPHQKLAIPAYRAIATLNTTSLPSPPSSTQVVSTAPVVRDSLAELLLPPSLQPEATYSAALPPVTPQMVKATAPQPKVSLPVVAVKPRPVRLAPVAPADLPAIAIPPSYTPQTFPQTASQTSVPFSPAIGSELPPPPQPVNASTAPVRTLPTAQISDTNTVPMNPAPSSSQPTSSDQMLQQILSQQNQAEVARQQATRFNQQLQQQLDAIPNSNQGSTSPSSTTGTQGLVEELQQLNKAE